MTQTRHRSLRARRAAASGVLALLAAAAPALATTGPTAQLAGGELFMGTPKVEVGARVNGSFGSTAAAPAGYNPRTQSGTILGFRVNPDECDWAAVGCATQGDFFTPGSPYEAWGLQVGAAGQAYDYNAATLLPGSFTSADPSGVSGVWQSAAPFQGVSVKQTYSVPAFAWMIDTRVELTNTTGATISDVYFMRGLDPDNCRMETTAVCDSDGDGVADAVGTTAGPGGIGIYETRNTIISQGSASTSALVTATQTNGTYLGLRAEGADARVFVKNSGFSNPPSLAALWGDANPAWRSNVGGSFGDTGIYAVVRVPAIAPGATATVRIQYIVKELPAAADFAETVPAAGALITIAARNGGRALAGICTAPSHGTAVVEGAGIRYTPAPGFTGADTVGYSTGGACGTVSITVPAPAPPPAPAAPFVVLTAPAKRKALASGDLQISQRLRIDRAGRYTFIYTDPATGKRVRQLPGSTVGSRKLGKRYSAPVLVTTRPVTSVTLVSVFSSHLPTTLRKRMALRVVLRNTDGTLSDVTP